MEIIKWQSWALPRLCDIWNGVVRGGGAFPQEEELDEKGMEAFLQGQSYAAMLCGEEKTVWGMYILHPNNIGRCGHIANASYAVDEKARGRGAGHALVLHSLKKAAELGFKGLQYNAVLCDNLAAVATYRDCGFQILARVPGGFRDKEGRYRDTFIMFHPLDPAEAPPAGIQEKC